MKVLSTATNIGQAFKNAGRVTEITSVFVRHGFADLIHRMKLSRFLPAKSSENFRQDQPAPERLRRAFEELGPTFVKLGQLLATRPDLIPENFVEEFQKLQGNVSAVPFSEIEEFLQGEFKKPLSEIFSEFEKEPMAAASIAQVHGAVLKTGERVAIKVQRPGIERVIQNDISILRGLAALLEKYIPEARPANPAGIVDEFFRSILYELDFMVEANNIRKIKKNMEVFDKVAIPNVFQEYSTNRVLVLERFFGIRLTSHEAVMNCGVNPSDIVMVGGDAFFHMVMHDGLFHGDLHPGNLFVLPDGKIGMIDFGIVGRLSKKVRDSIIIMFVALIEEDYETLAAEYVHLSQPRGVIDFAQLQKDLMDTISPYVGMSLGEINVGKLLLRSTATAVKHNLRVPRELMLLFKAMVTIEAMGRKLDPHFDMMEVGSRLARTVVSDRYSKERLMRDLLVIGRDLQSLLEGAPRLLRRFMKTWSNNGFAFETRNADTAELANAVDRFSRQVALSTLCLGLFTIGTVLLILDKGPWLAGFPVGAIVTMGLAFYLLDRNIRLLKKKKG